MMKRIVILSLSVLFLLALTEAQSAQDNLKKRPGVVQPQVPTPPQPANPDGKPCPSIGVQSQSGSPIRDGQHVVFVANINGGDQNVQPVIVWNISVGSIIQGQGTRRIEVDTTGAGSNANELRAEVWMSGYAPDCQLQAAGAVKLIAPATKFGEFGEVGADALAANIKALADFMTQSNDNVYFIAYAGRNSERGFTYNWMKRIKDALVDAGVPARRVMATDGGFREQPVFDFWIVPSGADLPRAEPTVKRTEIVYPKTTPAKKP